MDMTDMVYVEDPAYAGEEERPLARFLEDDNLRIMEELIPYCRPPLGRILALQIKLTEMQKILHDFEGPRLKACGLEEDSQDVEAILKTLKKSVSPERAAQIDSMLQMLNYGRMFQKFSQFYQEHPELLRMLAGDWSGGQGSIGTNDPSFLMMLNSMMHHPEKPE